MRTTKFLFFLIFLFGCTSDPQDVTTSAGSGDRMVRGEYFVSLEEALLELDNFMESLDPSTRSSYSRTIGTTHTVYRPGSAATRSSTSDDPLMYVVNFTSDDGFAVLGADSRIPGIMALTERGSLDPWRFPEKVYGWDPDGDHESESDSDSDQGDDEGPVGELGQDGTMEMMWDLMMGYAVAATSDWEYDPGWGDFDDEIECDDQDPDNLRPPLPDGEVLPEGPWPPNPEPTGPLEWTIVTEIKPLLNTVWNQRTPFNLVVNELKGNGKSYAAGCVAIAVAQIMNYHQYPAGYDWNKIGNVYSYDFLWRLNKGIPEEQYECARLISDVGRGCKTKYGTDGSSAKNQNVINYLRSQSYNNIERKPYSRILIELMISERMPVYISGVSETPGENNSGGHAWVLDGYILRRKGLDTQHLFHCNWGWGGLYNGYYVSGAFYSGKKLIYMDKKRGEYDEGYTEGNFKWKLTTIKYDRPN